MMDYSTFSLLQVYKVDFTPEPKEIAATETRRIRERERQGRFLNVDVEALNYQVEERKLQKPIEQNNEMAYGTKHVHYDLVAQMPEKEEAERAWQLSKKVQDFREQKQQYRSGHEFDPWDPDQLQEFPAPLYVSGPCYGPPNMQYFLVEDLHGASCLRMQQDLFRYYLERQLQEQEAREEKIRAATDSVATINDYLGWHSVAREKMETHLTALLSQQLQLAMDTRAAELARLEESCRASMRIAMANAKKTQAAKQAQQQCREHQQQQEAGFVKIKNQITSNLLTENSRAAQRPQGLHRILPFYLKSKTSEQGATTRKGQEVLHHEKKAQHRAEKALDTKWGSQTTALAKALLELEEQERELCAEFRRGLGSFNQELAKEQQASDFPECSSWRMSMGKDNKESMSAEALNFHRQNYLNSVIYTNQPTAQYYLQFNTSSR